MLHFKKIKAHKVMDPVLAFGRQNTIHFYQLSETLSGKINFIPLQKAELGFELLNFGWLNTRCMCLLDSTETFHLYDVRNQETLESIELTDAQLVYGSPFFKGMIINLFVTSKNETTTSPIHEFKVFTAKRPASL